MVLEGNQLGQSIWRARGYAAQPDWRRWVRVPGSVEVRRWKVTWLSEPMRIS